MKLYILFLFVWLPLLGILLLRFGRLLFNNIYTNESHRPEQVRILMKLDIVICYLLNDEDETISVTFKTLRVFSPLN